LYLPALSISYLLFLNVLQRLRDQDVLSPGHFKAVVENSFKNSFREELSKVCGRHRFKRPGHT
jgi:hypothetical protein